MIQEIIELAQGLDSKSPSFQSDCFSRLKTLNIDLSLEEFNSELAHWLTTSSLPTQLNVYNNFGQPPVTLFHNESFVIDLYFWLYSDTSIHTHSFTGAFKVLYGKSQQDIYQAIEKKKYTNDISLNDINIIDSRVIKKGECQEITRGDQFCHRVLHLDSPTITLCIRTINDKHIPQRHQFENGLSILKVELEETIYKQIFFYEYLLSQSQKMAKSFLNDIIEKSSPSLIMNLFEAVLSGSLGLADKSIEVFHHTIIKKFQKEEWFTYYLEACEA